MATEDARKLFVAGLPESISEEALRQIFEATGGKIVEVSLPRERATGKVRGFGFVTFASSDEALRARDALDGSIHAGRSISVRPFSSEPPKRGDRMDMRSDSPGPSGPGGGGGGGPPGGSEDRTLYVGNLPYDTNQQELSQYLTDAGVTPIARIHLPVGPDGRMRGFGFVTLGNAEAAQAALGVLNGAEVRGRRLMVNIAHPRGDRPPGFAGGGGFGGSRPSMGPGGGPPRYPTEPPMSFEGGGSPDHRARTAPPGGGGGETDWSEEAKKKKKKQKGGAAPAGRPGEERKRGGGGAFKPRLDYDDDD